MDNSLVRVLNHSLDERWNRFHKNHHELRRELTVEAVHDERTTSRSLISVLDVVGRLIGRKEGRGLQRKLRKLDP